MGEDPLAQVLQGARADPADQVGLQVGRGCVQGGDDDEGGDDPVEGGDVSGDDAVVDRLAGEGGGSETRAGRHQQRDEHQRNPAAIGAQQPDHPAHLAGALVLAADQPPNCDEQ